MTDQAEIQEREWQLLYDEIREVLQQFGKEDICEWKNNRLVYEWKDYLVVEENWGNYQHKIETENLNLLQPIVIKSLQKLLARYPNWEIVVGVGTPEKEKKWPAMGLVIRDNEIIDGLQRQYFPEEFRAIAYQGSRPHGSQFGDIMYTGPLPRV